MEPVRCVFADSLVLTKAELQAMLRPLSDLERLVVTLRLGLADGRPRSLAETGELLGLERERVRTLEARAYRRARDAG